MSPIVILVKGSRPNIRSQQDCCNPYPPYQALKKVGAIAYRLELPEGMSDIHPVFHVSQLRRCLRVPETEHVPVEAIDQQPDLRYKEIPVNIPDTVTRRTRNSEVRI